MNLPPEVVMWMVGGLLVALFTVLGWIGTRLTASFAAHVKEDREQFQTLNNRMTEYYVEILKRLPNG